jgi:hypothetical protein
MLIPNSFIWDLKNNPKKGYRPKNKEKECKIQKYLESLFLFNLFGHISTNFDEKNSFIFAIFANFEYLHYAEKRNMFRHFAKCNNFLFKELLSFSIWLILKFQKV